MQQDSAWANALQSVGIGPSGGPGSGGAASHGASNYQIGVQQHQHHHQSSQHQHQYQHQHQHQHQAKRRRPTPTNSRKPSEKSKAKGKAKSKRGVSEADGASQAGSPTQRGEKKTRKSMVVKTGCLCACCGVGETPLWRKGGNGQTLCNACGMRWIKYRMQCNDCQYV